MMTVSPASRVSLPRGMIMRPLRLMHATSRLFLVLTLLQRNPQHRRIPPHSEFQRLGLVGHDFIQCLYVAAHGVLHGPHILQDDVGRQHLGIYKAGLEEGTPQQDFRKDKMSDKRNLVLR